MAYRAKLNILLITAVLLFVVLFAPAHAAGWQGGGTAESPYLIYDANDMQAIGANPDDWDKHFKLMADIDMSAYIGTEYNIIGTSSNPFLGVFDGNGHKISNFIYNTTSTTYVGLFGYVYGAQAMIKDLGLLNPVINVETRAGTLVAFLKDGTVAGCSAEGVSVLTGDTNTGGLIAISFDGTIFDCYSSGSVWGFSSVGGLVGTASGGSISNCTSAASVSGNGDRVGGLIGNSQGGAVSNCYSTGSVSGFDLVGGFIGRNYDGMVNNCYSTGPVSGTGMFVGGLVGKNEGQFGSTGIVLNSFWDTHTSGQAGGDGSTGTGKTTTDMQDMNTFLDAGWDFVGETTNGPSDDWAEPVEGGYPVLWWQLPEGSLPQLPTFSGGTGESNNPYLISTATELNSIGHNSRLMEAHYRLVNDIDLTGVDFFIIGGDGIPFAGVFDGNNHIVSNFTYRVSEHARQIGVFGCTFGPAAEIMNLSLTDPNVIADAGQLVGSLLGCLKTGTISNCRVQNGNTLGIRHVGGLVGWNKGGTVTNSHSTGSVLGNEDYVGGLVGTNNGLVTNCYTAGSVEGKYDVGGLVGWNYTNGTISDSCTMSSVLGSLSVGGLVGKNESTVSNCSSSGPVVGYNSHVGGLVGSNTSSSIISNSHATGNTLGDLQVGGLAGENSGTGTVSNSYATGEAEGFSDVGGLVGKVADEAMVADCYSRGSAAGTENVGGLVGSKEWEGTIMNCYSTGSASGSSRVGGLIGWGLGGGITASFWDADTSETTSSNGGTAKSTADMQMAGTFTSAGWDFTTPIWTIDEGIDYPRLWWEETALAADINGDFRVDLLDFAILCYQWLAAAGVPSADIAPPGGDATVNSDDLIIFAANWLAGTHPGDLTIDLTVNETWMYQNLPGATDSNMIASVSITDDPMGNSSYTYEWEFVLPPDVSLRRSR